MFVRVKKIDSKKTRREYLQIVESFRNGKAVRQRVLFSLGRMDHLKNSGQIDGLIQSLARFSETLRVEKATDHPQVSTSEEKVWGPSLVFNQLWETQKLPDIINGLSICGHIQNDFERALFANVLFRVCSPKKSERIETWLKTVESPGFENLSMMQVASASNTLFENWQEFQIALYERDLQRGIIEDGPIFLYTFKSPIRAQKSVGNNAERPVTGPLKKSSSDLMVVATDAGGWPMGWKLLPGNVDDVDAFHQVIHDIHPDLKNRLAVIVANQGIIPDRVGIDLLGKVKSPLKYIIGYPAETPAMIDLMTCQPYEEILLMDGRYFTCFIDYGQAEMKIPYSKYLHELLNTHYKYQSREQDVSSSEPHSSEPVKAMESNARRVDRWIPAEAPKAFLMTDLSIGGQDVAAIYRKLPQISRFFQKHTHDSGLNSIKQHSKVNESDEITTDFIALRLKVELQHRLRKANIHLSWPKLMRDLKKLKVLQMDIDGKPFHLRSDFKGVTSEVLDTVGIHIPNRVSAI